MPETSLDVDLSQRLNKAATPDGILCVGAGKTAYVGRLDHVDWHRHATPVVVVGLAGNFSLATQPGRWLSCRAAVVPAGARHALCVGGEPLAVFYPEPHVATLSDLTRLGSAWDAVEQLLVAQSAEIGPFRQLYEDRSALGSAGEMLDELVDFLRAGKEPPVLDPRVARIVEWLSRNPADRTPLEQLVRQDGLSVSRFLHL